MFRPSVLHRKPQRLLMPLTETKDRGDIAIAGEGGHAAFAPADEARRTVRQLVVPPMAARRRLVDVVM